MKPTPITNINLEQLPTQAQSQIPPKKVVVVKQAEMRVVLQRRDEILSQINYVEVQIGRLAKMARDLRAMVTHIAVE